MIKVGDIVKLKNCDTAFGVVMRIKNKKHKASILTVPLDPEYYSVDILKKATGYIDAHGFLNEID